MPAYETNLAAEFHVLSCLHRRGLSANLTLGNKKGVDIVVALDAGDAVTVEVKGVAGKFDWPASNPPLCQCCLRQSLLDISVASGGEWSQVRAQEVPSSRSQLRAFQGRARAA